MVSSVLLAAGQSKRMGRVKQLMPWGHSTIVEQSIDNLLASVVNEVIVVVGYKAEEVRKAIGARPVKVVVNTDYEQGMSTSIAVGLSSIDSQEHAVMLVLGDQPLIGSQTINSLIDEFHRCDKGIVVPTYQGRRGNPVIFAARYKEELLRLKGDIGGRDIVKDHPEDVIEVAVATKSVLIDIDALSDYQSYLG